MIKKRKSVIDNNEISEIYTFNLGGYSQKVLIEGKSKDLPVVISLHGGPGTPIPLSVGCRGMFPEITDKVILVCWDQLGCGINNYIIDDNFKVESFVKMTCDLICQVKKIFPDNKLYIFSTSWGSVLSAYAAELKFNEIDGVVASGQIVNNLFFNDEVIKTLENSDIPAKKLNILKGTNSKNATSKEWSLMSSCLNKYTDAYNNKKGKKAPIFSIIKGLLTSPDYKFKDFKATMVNGYKGNNSIWNELLRIDLTEKISNVKIPYIIVQGDTDIVASTKTVKILVESSNNNNLKLHIVKDSGHLPSEDMMNEIFATITELAND